MFGKIKKYALATLAWILGNKSSDSPVFKAPVYLRHAGKGRNKQPHRFSGVAAAKRAAVKRKNKGIKK
ncbi:hypothetical protein [Neisseria sp. S1]|uniref:hypothetical protein n=1 Tax=Neisseria sp. S1 TaxID=3318354 RepID=UPI003A874E49